MSGRLLVLLASVGCQASIANGNGGLGVVDAPPGGGSNTTGDDAGTDGSVAAACTSRVLYLNFDGATLYQGPSDATTNHAAWMQIAQGTAPAYHAGVTNRMAQINAITNGVRQQLASFPITVVTTRPASGKYMMIVFGGTATQVGSRFGSAVDQLDCGDVYPNDLAWISDGVTGTQRIVNNVVGAIGFGVGLTATTDPNDCMCSWDNNCQPNNTAPCTLGAPIARDPTARQLCAGLTTQDEVATIHKAFCE